MHGRGLDHRHEMTVHKKYEDIEIASISIYVVTAFFSARPFWLYNNNKHPMYFFHFIFFMDEGAGVRGL